MCGRVAYKIEKGYRCKQKLIKDEQNYRIMFDASQKHLKIPKVYSETVN